MTKMSLIYNGELRTNLTHEASQVKIVTDAPTDNNGLGQSFSPTDMAASSLGACMATIIGIYCDKNKIELKGMSADIEKHMTATPSRRISEINVDLTINCSEISEKEMKKIEHAALNCPVAKSLSGDIRQNVTISFTQ